LFPSRLRESHTCRRGNTPASSIDGRTAPGSIARHMARILCAERSRRRFTRRPAICEQCSCCSATRSWRAPCVISGSRLMMRSASPSRSNFSRHICGPAKSQGRSPIRVDRRHHPVAYLAPYEISLRSLVGAEWGGERSFAATYRGYEDAPCPALSHDHKRPQSSYRVRPIVGPRLRLRYPPMSQATRGIASLLADRL